MKPVLLYDKSNDTCSWAAKICAVNVWLLLLNTNVIKIDVFKQPPKYYVCERNHKRKANLFIFELNHIHKLVITFLAGYRSNEYEFS